jgi:hypothetical protein
MLRSYFGTVRYDSKPVRKCHLASCSHRQDFRVTPAVRNSGMLREAHLHFIVTFPVENYDEIDDDDDHDHDHDGGGIRTSRYCG